MEISNDLKNKLYQCNWLENCSTTENADYHFEVVFTNNPKKAVKGITSVKWEKFCLEKRGDFTAYLFQNHRQEYNELWNKTVREIKSSIFPPIESKIKAVLENRDLPEDILHDILFNLITILMIDFYSCDFKTEFFDNLLIVYLSGHLPCGMEGEKLIVY